MQLSPLIAQHGRVYLHSCYGICTRCWWSLEFPMTSLQKEKKKPLKPATTTQASDHVLTCLLYILPDVSFLLDEVWVHYREA